MSTIQLSPSERVAPEKTLIGKALPSLTGMRWVAAFMVFGLHIQNLGFFKEGRGSKIVDTAFAAGAVGVSFFFILSGFVLTWSARPGENPLRFWRRRLARIYPLHFVTALIALILAVTIGLTQIPSTFALVSNLLVIQSWSHDYSVYQSLNKVSWTLTCEVLFYVSFPLLAWLIRKLNFRWTAVVTAVSALAVVALAVFDWKTGSSADFYFYAPVRLPEFTLGIGLARLVMFNRWRGPGLEVSLAITLIGYFMAKAVPSAFGNTCVTLLGFSLLIPAAALADVRGTESFWRRPGIVRLGELSFAFYMIHMLVMETTRKLLPQFSSVGTASGIVVSAVLFVICLGLAWLLYEYVEQPARKLISGRSKNKKIAPAVA